MLSESQQAALGKVRAWLATGSREPFRLFGYAGTGKTTIAHAVREFVNGPVLYACYTGKAAWVLQQKDCPATTIHKLIYRPKDKSRLRLMMLQEELSGQGLTHARKLQLLAEIGEEERNLKRPSFSLNLDSPIRDAKLVVIDEVSMVGRRIGEDLLSFNVPILVLGDPMQLPPVMDGGFFTDAKPDVLLTEIHRQAAGSPVLALADRVRRTGTLPEPGDLGHGSRILKRGTLTLEDIATQFDQILVGKNKTRHSINGRIRMEHLKRKSPLPEPGDKLICLRNDANAGMLNGQQWTTVECNVIDEDTLDLSIVSDEGLPATVMAHRHIFEGREIPHQDVRKAQMFDHAQAITVHKAQGSEFPRVLVIDESAAFGASARNHLYTAITRAAQSVTVVV